MDCLQIFHLFILGYQNLEKCRIIILFLISDQLITKNFIQLSQKAISASKIGRSQVKCKKVYRSWILNNDIGEIKKNGSDKHQAVFIGYTVVGDPFQDILEF